jgi:SAM-dependent methyltransferase
VTLPSDICPVCAGTETFERYPDELGGLDPTVDYRFTPQTRKTYRIAECLECSHQFVSPLPSVSHLYETNVDHTYLQSLHQRHKSASAWLQIVRMYSPNIQPHNSLLDVGCATGVFLDCASHHMRVEGIELSNWASNIASQRHRVHQKQLEELDFSQKFNIVTLWGVIEHLEHPRNEIRAINKHLVNGGLLFVYTGDRSAILPRILRKRWWWYQGMHIQYFTKSSLQHLLVSEGFKIVTTKRLPIFFSLHSLGQSFNRYTLARPIVWLLQLFPKNKIFLRLKLSEELLVVAPKPPR